VLGVCVCVCVFRGGGYPIALTLLLHCLGCLDARAWITSQRNHRIIPGFHCPSSPATHQAVQEHHCPGCALSDVGVDGRGTLSEDHAQLAGLPTNCCTATTASLTNYHNCIPRQQPQLYTSPTAGPQVLDAHLHSSGNSGPFFCGQDYSLAEIGTTPHLKRVLVTLPRMRGVDAMQVATADGLTLLVAWMKVRRVCYSSYSTRSLT